MTNTHYEDPTGLSPRNVSTANDLAKLVRAAADYPLIRDYSTTPAHHVEVQPTGQMLGFNNSNALVKNGAWDIQLQKTGYIREAGRCVVMLATIASQPDGHRAARFDRQVHASGRCPAGQALARDRRDAFRRPPVRPTGPSRRRRPASASRARCSRSLPAASRHEAKRPERVSQRRPPSGGRFLAWEQTASERDIDASRPYAVCGRLARPLVLLVELLRVRPGLGGDLRAAQHAGEFLHALCAGEAG